MAAPTGLIWRVPEVTPRLRYVLRVVFSHWLGIPCRVVSAAEAAETEVPTGWRLLAYGTEGPADLRVAYSGFLTQSGTEFILPRWDEKGFFPGEGDYPWDLPAMAFYVLTLYPLYHWPYGYDDFGLYAWHRAPFYAAPFWREPFLLKHAYALLERLGLRVERPPFRWEVGWDIDHLYQWKGRGGLRWWLGGLLRRDLPQRLEVRWKGALDPYDTLASILAAFPPAHSRFFFLLSQAHRRDSLVSPHHPDVRAWVQRLDQRGYAVGIHPSFTTCEKPHRLAQEKNLLETYLGHPVYESRQHYLRYRWPQLLHHLVEVGIQTDYTLAFPERSGFLLGTTLPVAAYDVAADRELPLKLVGPALMDQVYLRRGDVEVLERELERLYQVVKEVGGVLHVIWHNSTWARLPEAVRRWPREAG